MLVTRSSKLSLRCQPRTFSADDVNFLQAVANVLGAAIQRYADLGFDRIYLHNVGRNQREWIDVFSRDVLPKITR